MLKKGKLLPLSDQKYLESILPLYLSQKDMGSTQQYEHVITELHREIETLNEKLSKSEMRFEKYIGKKAILFFVTVFVGWNALQPYFVPLLNIDISNDVIQYLFPLNILANYFGGGLMIDLIFILMVLAWPFIGAVLLIDFIKTHKFSA
jgi:hypothetical protein